MDPLLVPIIAFASGIGTTLTGALIANILTRKREQQALVDSRRFEIYMKLMDLNARYSVVVSAEARGKPVAPEILKGCHGLSWEIADLLRSADEVAFLEETLDVIFSPRYLTAMDRYITMGRLLENFAKRVNPRYAKKIREISEANIKLVSENKMTNAPGATFL